MDALPLTSGDRRVIRSRQSGWARALADGCVRRGVSADRMSVWGLLAAVAAAAVLTTGAAGPMMLLAAALIQLRLLANMLDGMVAERSGSSRLGPLYNEIPDRIADAFVLCAAGVAIHALDLGLLAALAAIATAYVRGTAVLVGMPAPFGGPMAKPRRMHTLTAALVLAAVVPGRAVAVLTIALAVITVGSVATAWRRVAAITRTGR